MIAILIAGLLLFIVGVGATFLWDHQKAFFAKRAIDKQQRVAASEKRTMEEAAEQKSIMDKYFAQAYKPKQPVSKPAISTSFSRQRNKVIKPGSIKVGFHKPGEPLTEIETTSLQDIIDQVERMKKK